MNNPGSSPTPMSSSSMKVCSESERTPDEPSSFGEHASAEPGGDTVSEREIGDWHGSSQKGVREDWGDFSTQAINTNIHESGTAEWYRFMSFLRSLKESAASSSVAIDSMIARALAEGQASKAYDLPVSACAGLVDRTEKLWRWFLKLIGNGQIGGNLAQTGEEFRQIAANIQVMLERTSAHSQDSRLANATERFEKLRSEIYEGFPPLDRERLEEVKQYNGEWISLESAADGL
jgi:hypothetical protein